MDDEACIKSMSIDGIMAFTKQVFDKNVSVHITI